MYKFHPDPKQTLCENEQLNPIRWQLLYRDGDDFYPQTVKFRCKDYLNDVAAKYHGKSVIAYGLDNDKFKLNAEGTWLKLTNISKMETFCNNINTLINQESEVPISVEPLDNTSCLVFIPLYYYKQTYLVSLASFLIRLSNYGEEFKSFEEALESSAAGKDKAISHNGKKVAQNWRFTVPEKYQKYWFYYNNEYTSDNTSLGGTTIHNCGINAWADGVVHTLKNKEKVAA